MNFLPTMIVLILGFVTESQAQNVVCIRRKSSNTITVNGGKSFSYKTQKGKKYTGSTSCTTNYKLGSTCAALTFACSSSNINNKDKKPGRCNKGDKMIVTTDGKTKKFCRSQKANIKSTVGIKVQFISDKKVSSTGAKCKITCTTRVTTPPPPPPPTTTTKTTTSTTSTPQTTGTTSEAVSGCSCGTRPSSFVVGGSPAGVNSYPWMAMLELKSSGRHFCGGAVINSRWIATAAHCLSKYNKIPVTQLVKPSSFWVVLGEHSTSTNTETSLTKRFRAEKIEIHRNKKGKPTIVDLALIKVKEVIDLSIYTPICLPKSYSFNPRGKYATLTGWGLKSCPSPNHNPECIGGQEAKVLQEISLPVTSQNKCPMLHSKQFCFGGATGKSGCFGDSGSPLAYNEGGRWSLVGSVQGGTGTGCGYKGSYGVSWESAKYLKWYRDTAKGANYCPY